MVWLNDIHFHFGGIADFVMKIRIN